ncbi:hypothetical protein [Trinickia fusca]|uniref:Uncharacterized protein n=1 Tax=Trinickia fusca TaxID=2419777 RepID=A0A494X901_9BURK|nr:hypothetical protein [Trinickia fusca]RKP44559.1 hypothetical protein D7S89_22020 [Trinickia fusca]
MKDRRVAAFGVMLKRKRRLGETLRETLAKQRAAHAALVAAEQERKVMFDEEVAQLAEYDQRLTSMLTSRSPMSIPQFTHCSEYRTVVAERKTAAEAEWTKARKAEQQHNTEMAETSRQILRNDGQIDVYARRIEKLKLAAAQSVEDAQDEEVEESMAARALRARRDASAGEGAVTRGRASGATGGGR